MIFRRFWSSVNSNIIDGAYWTDLLYLSRSLETLKTFSIDFAENIGLALGMARTWRRSLAGKFTNSILSDICSMSLRKPIPESLFEEVVVTSLWLLGNGECPPPCWSCWLGLVVGFGNTLIVYILRIKLTTYSESLRSSKHRLERGSFVQSMSKSLALISWTECSQVLGSALHKRGSYLKSEFQFLLLQLPRYLNRLSIWCLWLNWNPGFHF